MAQLRETQAKVNPLFVERYSPRLFRSEPIPPETVAALFEAARWAPSSFNEQPWFFLYATKEADRQLFASLLVDANRVWAERAPLLMFVCAKRTFSRNGKPNRHHAFDAGAAWMSLAFAAHQLGLEAHAMAGFDHDRSYDTLGLSRDDYEVMAAIAAGKVGDGAGLPEQVVAGDKTRTPRKPLSEVAIEGRFNRG